MKKVFKIVGTSHMLFVPLPVGGDLSDHVQGSLSAYPWLCCESKLPGGKFLLPSLFIKCFNNHFNKFVRFRISWSTSGRACQPTCFPSSAVRPLLTWWSCVTSSSTEWVQLEKCSLALMAVPADLLLYLLGLGLQFVHPPLDIPGIALSNPPSTTPPLVRATPPN